MSARVDLVEGFLIALKSLRSYGLRTVLTTLGIGIGVATLLAILGITQGLDASFQKQLASLGTASVYVSKYPWVVMGDWWVYRNRKNLSLSELEAVRAQCTKCSVAVPILDDNDDVEFLERKLTFVPVTGSSEDWLEVSTFEVQKGRFLTHSDDEGRRKVVVIGADIATTLFPHGAEPLGTTIRVGGHPFVVIGVLGRKGKLLDQNQDLSVVIPFNTFRALLRGRRSIDLGVRVLDPDKLGEAEDQLVGILRRARQTPPDKADDFAINKPEQLTSMYQKLTGALYGVAVGIGFITLLVGGIGIMNIMLVSVRERTREIGIRRALGARRRTIITQFIIEATLVSAVGGAMGTVVGLGGALVVSQVTPLAAAVKPSTVLFGVLFAALVGLVFGIWPAARAANLDPVEALREEMIRELFDNFRLALGTFVAHPLRTVLTLLGIVIGVATVMTMMALLEGLRVKVNRDLSQLGANVFRIDKWPPGFHFGNGGIDWNRIARRAALTVDDKRALGEHCPSVLRTAASAWQPAQKVRTAETETQPNVWVLGTTVEYPETSGVVIARGRYFNDSEGLDGRQVVVLGPDVADRVFPDIDPVGQQVRLKDRPFTVAGVLERRGQWLGLFNLDNQVMIPLSTFFSMYGKRRSVSLSVEAKDAGSVPRAMEEATRVMRQRRNVAATDENDFEVSTNESMAKTLNDLSAVVTAATFGICLLSLVVGGIGILNIMLVSVTERTREIGVRKALGARRRRILFQFATEAVVLALVGGLVGIAIGYGLAFLGRWALGLYTAVPTWAVLLSLGMSSGVGLVFGIYPAARASRLDPVEAMRAE